MSGKNFKPRAIVVYGILALLTLAVFWRVFGCDFTDLDDNLYVANNSTVQKGLTLAGLKYAFTSTVASNWHPLTWLSHMLDCQIFGAGPFGPHLMNLLFHIANTLLVFAWLRRLTGALWKSALVAALFAWHPIHVESVAWVSERKDVLSTFFFLLTLLAYQKFKIAGPKSKLWYAAALFLFLLGLLSKPMVVTLPFVLLLIDFWSAENASKNAPKGKPQPLSALPWKKWVVEKIPFFALSAASSAVTYFAQKHSGAVETLEKLPIGERIANAAISYVRYLEKAFWPVDLAVFYPHPDRSNGMAFISAFVLLAAITLFVLKFRRGRPWLAVGWFWFLGTLVPVIGLVQVGGQSMADRYAYIPLIGIFIIVAWGLGEWVERKKIRPATVAVPASAALMACMALTWNQTGYWKDSGTLFEHDIKLEGYSYLACYDMATYLMINDKDDEALFFLNKALAISPAVEPRITPVAALAHNNCGAILMEKGDLDGAFKHISLAVQLVPTNADWHLSLGKLYAKQGKTDDAINQFQAALLYRTNWADPYVNWGAALAESGNLSGAIEQLTAGAKADPTDPDTQNQIAVVFAKEHKSAEALEHYREAARLYREAIHRWPDSTNMLNNFAWFLATNPNDQLRNGPEAVKYARKACEISHWHVPIVIGTFAAACAEAGQFDEAENMARKARETALALGDNALAARNEELLKVYQAHKPYHEQVN
ncbi:MAG TPA: tetratricopeptide repeat protein [Verrucomicrobiae bacterium]|nr:tetratricopeptide repeat protein [Verrucomicrobiae bacterium]